MESSSSKRSNYPWLWRIPLASFLLAALTGFLYRLGLVGWLPGWLGLGLDNIRHAHSHLMFFGWAVPFPLYILLRYIIDKSEVKTGGITLMRHSIAAGLFLGILSFPFFLLYGYRPMELGSMSLPFSVIISGLVMITWYTFGWGYLRARKTLHALPSQPWFDGALLLLVISSLGAWGVAVVQAIDPANQLFMKGLTHFFLATFTEGWMVLAVIAILLLRFPLDKAQWTAPPDWALGAITVGAPLTFALGISDMMLSPTLSMTARVGGFLVAAGTLIVLLTFWLSGALKSSCWRVVFILLGMKAIMQLAASFYPSLFWLSDHGLRILYLHILLLGTFSLTMFAWWQEHLAVPKSYHYAISGSILAVLASLIFPTSFWPAGWSGVWVYQLLAMAAPLPILTVSAAWIRSSITNR